MIRNGIQYGSMMRSLNPETAARIGIGNPSDMSRGDGSQRRFDWAKGVWGELCEGEPIARIARMQRNKARCAPGAVQ